MTELSTTEYVTSPDGTRIAFQGRGSGPAVILVGGAFSDRNSLAPLADLLKNDFRVHTYDRRGRGDSGDTPPYEAGREIEDVNALIGAVGGKAMVFGHSSGAILALLSAAAGQSIVRLATYEPPYAADAAGDLLNSRMMGRLERLLAENKNEEAVCFWLEATGMPASKAAQMKSTPFWPAMLAKAPTLMNELKLKVAAGNAFVPSRELAHVAVPLLAMAGGLSEEWMKSVSRDVAQSVAVGRYLELPAQHHMVDMAVVAPLLKDFYVSP